MGKLFQKRVLKAVLGTLGEGGGKTKVKLSLYRPWGPLGLREVETRTFSDIQLIVGGKVVSPMPQLFSPWKIPGTHFCYRLSRPQGPSAAGRIR
jgi:hypothetical protein